MLKSFLLALFKKEGKRVDSIAYVFCTDEYLLQLNKEHLNHDTYTDIISFDLSEPGQKINAEIYISTDRVKENSITYHTSFKRELHRVIFHGALHLCGYKDKSKADQQEMRKQENHYLDQYFRP
jgi:probable rRNA maturation factor